MLQRHEGWMFLSHSNKDFDLVRQIRNTLEDHGFRPIVFFLKCVSDSDELDGLIKREIAARRWFVFVDSPHSRTSKWAQEELAYANELGKTVYTIDSSADYLPQLQAIMRRSTVFLSYSHRDQALVNKIRSKLIEHDFQVWTDDSISVGTNWVDEITQHLTEACVDGFVVPIITEHFLESRHCAMELYHALEQNGRIIPVYCGVHNLPDHMEFLLKRIQGIWMDDCPSEDMLDYLVNTLISFDDSTVNRK